MDFYRNSSATSNTRFSRNDILQTKKEVKIKDNEIIVLEALFSSTNLSCPSVNVGQDTEDTVDVKNDST